MKVSDGKDRFSKSMRSITYSIEIWFGGWELALGITCFPLCVPTVTGCLWI